MSTATPPAAGRLAGIHLSLGGVPKRLVPEARITTAGLEGDRQRDLRHHGGPERAVSLFALEVIEALAAEGHPIAPGSTGENLTLAGLDWARLVPGCELAVGAVRLQVTRPCTPCSVIAGSFTDGDFRRLWHQLHPGRTRLYARVLEPGVVRVGDPVVVTAAG